jgi:hypothetical protein
MWSKSEKAIARKLFDAALKQELHEVMQEAKQKANQIKEPADVWELERSLTQRRKDVESQVRFSFVATDAGVWQTLVRRSNHSGRTARLTRGQSEGDPSGQNVEWPVFVIYHLAHETTGCTGKGRVGTVLLLRLANCGNHHGPMSNDGRDR